MHVSVVIPTFNRWTLLMEALGSLAQQKWPMKALEVIVVDDGSTDGTERVAHQSFPFALRYLRQTNQGSAAARNAGAHAAGAALLVFIDDDMLLAPEYIAGLVDEHLQYQRIVGMGTTLPYIPTGATAFGRIYARLSASPVGAPGSAFVDFTDCVTNNLSVNRADYFQVGAMQDISGDGPTWWGDVDFGYRAAQQGFRFRRSGRSLCWHRDYSIQDLATGSARARTAARMAVALFRKYPALQARIPVFHDKGAIAWRQDPPRLIGRKLARRVAASGPAMAGLEQTARLLERRQAPEVVLGPLYRWIIGGYICRGYREGLREHV